MVLLPAGSPKAHGALAEIRRPRLPGGHARAAGLEGKSSLTTSCSGGWVFDGSIWTFAAAATATATSESGSPVVDEPVVVVGASVGAVVADDVPALEPQALTKRAIAIVRARATARATGGALARRSNCLPAPVL